MSILWSVVKNLSGKRPSGNCEINTGNALFPMPKKLRGGQIIAFYGASAGDALKELTYLSLVPLANDASAIVLIDLNSTNWIDELKFALREPVWFAASFFGVGEIINVDVGDGVVSLWEHFSIPFMRFFGDIPAYFPDSHLMKGMNSLNVYSDPLHVDYFQKWVGKGVGVVAPPLLIKGKIPDFAKKIKGKVRFPKNGNSPDSLMRYWRNSLPPMVSKSLFDLAEVCISEDMLNACPRLDELASGYFEGRGIFGIGSSTILFVVAQLDDYIRRVKSTIVANAILDLPVVVSGRNWDHVKFDGRRAVLDSNNCFNSTQESLGNALAIIDMSPNTNYLIHDRVGRAIGSKTAFLTNFHPRLVSETISPDQYMFKFEEHSIAQIVESAISNPGETVELGVRQHDCFEYLFNEDIFRTTLLCAIDAISLRLDGRPINTQDFVGFPSAHLQ